MIGILPLSVLCLISFRFAVSLDKDPYKLLGINRDASAADIKKAYKQLAREFHPDKNKDADAESKFIEISEAYELLSDPKKKENYDKYGTFDDSSRGGGGYDDSHFFHSSFFDDFGFRMPEPSAVFQKHRISFRFYEDTIVSRSHSQPYLIFVYSDWCFACKHLEPLWQRIIDELEPMQYGLGTVNNVYQGILVRRLQIRRLPSIVAVVEGRVLHYREEYTFQNVVKFAKNAIPAHVVQPVSDDNYDYFLSRWKDNRAPVLMFSPLEKPRLRYLIAAFKYRYFAAFGYVDIRTKSTNMRKEYNIDYDAETLLIFNEQGRAAFIQNKEISSQALYDAVNKHRILLLPRLSSQEHFDLVCGDYCAVLCIRKGYLGLSTEDEALLEAFRLYASEFARGTSAGSVKFAYVFVDKQKSFANAIKLPNSAVEGSYRDVLLLKRVDSNRIRYVWLERSFALNSDGMKNKLEKFSKELAKFTSKTAGPLKNAVAVEPFYNELGPGWYHRLSYKTMRAYESFMYHMDKEELLPLLTLAGTMVFIVLISWCFKFMTNLEDREERELNAAARRPLPREKTFEFNTLCKELRGETYNGLVKLLKPGCRTLVVLIDGESQAELVRSFTHCVWPWRKNPMIAFAFLNVEKNLDWYRRLLSQALNNPARLLNIDSKKVIGTVLCLNGFRHYFQIYHAKHKSNNSGNFLGLNDDAEDENSSDSAENEPLLGRAERSVNVCDLLAGLPNWLDRLFEGSIRRYTVQDWPPIR